MTRRGLFATLLAPLVARFAPKPKPTGTTFGLAPAWDRKAFPEWDSEDTGAVTLVQWDFTGTIEVPNPRTCYRLHSADGRF